MELLIDEKLRREQTEKVAAVRKRGDNDKVRWALDGLRRATLGEIIGVLRETWGEYVEQNII